MTTDAPTNSHSATTSPPPRDLTQQFVCPYCGVVNMVDEGPCPNCTMENSAAARNATKARIGPWYVLQKRNPAAPGMKFETLLSFVRRGRVKAHSIVRGPTTHQLWRFAAQVKGLSREFGVCYSCASQLANDASVCPQCNRPQGLPPQPDVFLESADGQHEAAVVSDVAGSTHVESPHTTPPDDIPDLHAVLDDASANGEHDIVIPSLQEATPPSAPRPSGPRQRLANLRHGRIMPSQRSEPLDEEEEDDLEDAAADSYSPPSSVPVGPTFVAPARPMGPPPRKRMWVEATVFVLVLVAAAVSGLFYVDPHLQVQAQSWLNRGLSAIGISVAPKPSDAQPAPTPDVAPPPPVTPVFPPLTTSNDAALHYAASAPVSAAPTNSSAASGPAPSPTPPDAATRLPVVTVPPHVDPAPVAPEVPPAVEPAPPDVPSASTDGGEDDPFKRSRALRNRAIDAENSGHYDQAVTLFEQIKDLPREAWPGDLELRLKAARANAEGKPRH